MGVSLQERLAMHPGAEYLVGFLEPMDTNVLERLIGKSTTEYDVRRTVSKTCDDLLGDGNTEHDWAKVKEACETKTGQEYLEHLVARVQHGRKKKRRQTKSQNQRRRK